ncbi:uncharacterized protein LOC108343921 isoform X3 [Vigna angularis]|uniref:uncharacterized protein LOC108343921 isoform X3 n=1 Tax=Phaseolus angularis TaxID=3914 RepID=UPI00080A33FB|nr:uncharacterized protein LOC108343921 isoform X3 [Vigna angularis]
MTYASFVTPRSAGLRCLLILLKRPACYIQHCCNYKKLVGYVKEKGSCAYKYDVAERCGALVYLNKFTERCGAYVVVKQEMMQPSANIKDRFRNG